MKQRGDSVDLDEWRVTFECWNRVEWLTTENIGDRDSILSQYDNLIRMKDVRNVRLYRRNPGPWVEITKESA